jgi:hypothetical protein
MKYDEQTRGWTLYWFDRNSRARIYDLLEPNQPIERLLEEHTRTPRASSRDDLEASSLTPVPQRTSRPAPGSRPHQPRSTAPTARQLRSWPVSAAAGRTYSRAGSPELRYVMSLSESQIYEAGMSLPPDVRKHVALRLLESVDPQEAFDRASESWLRTEAAAAYDALKVDPSRVIPAEDIRAGFEAKWSARS